LSGDEFEYLDNVRVLGRAKFGECFEIDAVSIETIYNKLSEEEETSSAPKLSVNLNTTVTTSTDSLLIGATTLPNVFSFMQAYKAKSGDPDLLYEKKFENSLGTNAKSTRVSSGHWNSAQRDPDCTTMALPSLRRAFLETLTEV